MYKKIVVGTDGSHRARRAVDAATALAKTFGSELYIVSAYTLPSTTAAATATGAMVIPETTDDEVRTAVDGILRDEAERVSQEGVAATTYACAASPTQALLDVAEQEDCDLIVVGNRGMTGARRLLGSVPNKVSHHAGCSVLIVDTD